MDRRRFLKYAGATAALVGASALGVNYFSSQTSSSLSRTTFTPVLSELTTSTSSSASSITATQSVQLVSLQGRLFFDYNGNGVQDGEEPPVARASVQLKDSSGSVVAADVTDSSGGYEIDILAGSYRLYIKPDNTKPNSPKFRYMCRSPAEFTDINEGYDLTVLSPSSDSFDVGLIEGPLTVCYPNGTKYFSATGAYVSDEDYMRGRFYDRDPRIDTYLWWNGHSGLDPQRGSPLHANSDHMVLGVDFGTPVVASAPGTVSYLGVDTVGGGLRIEISHHVNNLATQYIHLSKQLVSLGQPVARGETIGLSGPGELTGHGTVYQETAFAL